MKLPWWGFFHRRAGGAPVKTGAKAAARAGASARDRPRLPFAACATVIIPALNEAQRIAGVVAHALADPATAEVIVIDDSSIDDTANLARQAGARVVTSSMLGKGASMRDGVGIAATELLVYLDGDLVGLRRGIITDLSLPILRDEADFVKARFGRSGGRVTELTAKPMLQIFFPEIAHIRQPLGGIIAVRRRLLQSLTLEDGYGVDVGLLIDAHVARARIAEVDIGFLEHGSQPLRDLAVMANEVSRVIFSRARLAGRLHVDQIAAMYETQRQAASELDYVLTRRKGRQRLLLLCMGDIITPACFHLELARLNGQEDALRGLMDSHRRAQAGGGNAPGDTQTHLERVAGLFRFVHRQQFERVARGLEIRPGLIELVNQMRRHGFMVGVVSDGYFVAADIVRRRIFADFALAHTIQFDGEVCTGQLRFNPAYLPDWQDPEPAPCKSHVLRHFLSDATQPEILTTWALGNCADDLTLLQLADRAFAIATTSPEVRGAPGVTHLASVAGLLELLPNHELVDSDALMAPSA